MNRLTKLSLPEVGQGVVEYALILVLAAVVAVLALALTGEGVAEVFCQAAAGIGAEDVCSEGCQDAFANMEDWEVSRGGWEAQDGQLCNTKLGEGRVFNACSRSLPSDDYTVRLDAANLARGNGYGIWFRSGVNEQGRREGYTFQYDPGWGKGAFIFRKWVNGYELSPFAVRRAPGFDWHGSDHDVEVVVEGNVFKAVVDGEVVLEAKDDTYSEGNVGLRTWDGTRICVNDFSVAPTWPRAAK